MRKIVDVLKRHGVGGLLVATARYLLPLRLGAYRSSICYFSGNLGLEIGGPSQIFRRGGLFPVYSLAKRIDNCNFGCQTIWEGVIAEGVTFSYDKRHPPGNQFVAEATDLAVIDSGSYDFILSSHVLEHIANPLKAIEEWIRVLKVKGVLVLIVPDKDGTFDHQRPVTKIAHLIDDYARCVGEDDLTHLNEILALHDLAMDSGISDFEGFRERSLRNVENRGLHHHVFDTNLAIEVLCCLGLQILKVEVFRRPRNILVVAQKLSEDEVNTNIPQFRNEMFESAWKSRYSTDRAME